MSHYHNDWDPNLGKASRIRMIRQILTENQGRMKRSELKKQLTRQGYHGLIDQFEAMGFKISKDGHVYGG